MTTAHQDNLHGVAPSRPTCADCESEWFKIRSVLCKRRIYYAELTNNNTSTQPLPDPETGWENDCKPHHPIALLFPSLESLEEFHHVNLLTHLACRSLGMTDTPLSLSQWSQLLEYQLVSPFIKSTCYMFVFSYISYSKQLSAETSYFLPPPPKNHCIVVMKTMFTHNGWWHKWKRF